MFHLLFMIISYGALLLLLMPATIVDLLLTVLLLILGISVILHKKVYKTAFWKNRQYLLIAVTISIVAYFRSCFCQRWLLSYKMQAIASMLNIPIELIVLIGSLIEAVLLLRAVLPVRAAATVGRTLLLGRISLTT